MKVKDKHKARASANGKAKESKADTLKKLREEQATKGAKGSKKTAIVKAEKVEILPKLTEDEKRAKAASDNTRFRELETNSRKNFVEMGMILREIKAYDLHKYILSSKNNKPFHSFDAWLKDAAPLSRASGYSALKVIDKLLPVISQKELEAMPRYSSDLLAKIPRLTFENPVKREKLVTAAKTQTKKELVKTIRREAPEAHVEGHRVINIRVDESAAPVILDAFQAVQDLNEVSEAEALENICTSWLDAPCELEEYNGMSNRQAWDAWKQSQNAAGTGEAIREMDNENDAA